MNAIRRSCCWGLFVYLLNFCSIAAFAEDQAVPGPHLMNASHWVLKPEYSDEFNEAELNKEKWDDNSKSWGTWSWDPANISLGKGQLHIKMVYEPHERGEQKLYYKSGMIKSKAPPIKYGFFEARIKGCAAVSRRLPSILGIS